MSLFAIASKIKRERKLASIFASWCYLQPCLWWQWCNYDDGDDDGGGRGRGAKCAKKMISGTWWNAYESYESLVGFGRHLNHTIVPVSFTCANIDHGGITLSTCNGSQQRTIEQSCLGTQRSHEFNQETSRNGNYTCSISFKSVASLDFC